MKPAGKSASTGILFFCFLLMYQFVFLGLFSGGMRLLTRAMPNVQTDALFQMPWFIVLMQCVTLLLPLGIWLAIHKENLNDHLPTLKLGRTNIIFITAITCLMLPHLAILSGLAALFFPSPVASFLGETQSHSVWALLLAVAVTPAIVEEVVFRGYIQSQFASRPFWQAALIGGLFFGLIHMSLQQFPYAFAMGIVMAYMVHFTRSVRAGILAHFIVNGVNIVGFRFFAWVLRQAEEMMHEGVINEATEPIEASPWSGFLFLGAVALVFLPLLVVLFRAFIAHNRRRTTVYDIKQALEEE